MCPQMGVSPDKMESLQPLPNAWYDWKIKSITCALAAKKDSYNYRINLAVVNTGNPEWDHKRTTALFLNTKAPWTWPEVLHGAGFGDDVLGDEKLWTFDKNDPNDVAKATYSGPLLGKILHAETIDDGQYNQIKQITCKIPDCKIKFPKIRHSTNMIGKKK